VCLQTTRILSSCRPILDVSQSIFDSFWYTIYSDPQILIERQFTIYPFRRVYTLLRLVVKSSKFTSKSTHYSSVHSQVQVQKTQVTAHRVIIHQENVEKSGNYCKLVREKSGETTCIMSFCKPARANTLNSEIEFQLCLRFSTSLAPNNVFLVLWPPYILIDELIYLWNLVPGTGTRVRNRCYPDWKSQWIWCGLESGHPEHMCS